MAEQLTSSVLVKIRDYCGAYVARCAGKSASSTSSQEFAAAAAAAKHFKVLPRRIRLHPNADGSFLAMPESSAPIDWPHAGEIAQEKQARMLRPIQS
jgi:hypothetical protein